MKKIIPFLSIGLICSMIFSCTPQAIPNDETQPQACCGDDMHFPPPPADGFGG